jgi:hypothetical protein
VASRHELDLEQKMNLIRDKENGLSHRQLKEKFQVPLGAISNILKSKNEYQTLIDVFLDTSV